MGSGTLFLYTMPKADGKKKPPSRAKSAPGKSPADKREKTRLDRENQEERPVIQPGSGRRFLLGCCFPALLFLILCLTASLPAVWCILRVRAPQYIPRFLADGIHLLRYASSTFYHLTEQGLLLAGNTEPDPLARASDSLFARVESGDREAPAVWQISAYRARRSGGGLPPEEFTFTDRAAFLRSLRIRGEYLDHLRFPTLTTYKAGKTVRLRMCPAENGNWLFDCRFLPAGSDAKPWTGWILRENTHSDDLPGDRAELYLAGIRIAQRFFSDSCCLRGEEGLSQIKPEERMFYLYAFGSNGERLRAAVRSGSRGDLNALSLQKRMIFGPGGASLFPDPLIRMAVKNSDLALLKLLLRDKTALNDIAAETSGPAAFTTLHQAAIQPDPRVLAKIIPLYPNAHPVEPLSGATPFLAAVMADRPENVLLFLRRKEKELALTLPDGSSALHLAVLNLSPEVAELLLLHGADKNARNKTGETPGQLLRRLIRENGWEHDPDALRLTGMLP